jgi:hypothetical protein
VTTTLDPTNLRFTLARKSQRRLSALESIAVVSIILVMVLRQGKAQNTRRLISRSRFTHREIQLSSP